MQLLFEIGMSLFLFLLILGACFWFAVLIVGGNCKK